VVAPKAKKKLCVIVLGMDATLIHFPTHSLAPQLGTKPHFEFEDKRCEKAHYLQGLGRGGGDRTRPPNYKVPWNEGVAAARKIQLLILLTDLAAQVETNARMFEPPTSWSRTVRQTLYSNSATKLDPQLKTQDPHPGVPGTNFTPTYCANTFNGNKSKQ